MRVFTTNALTLQKKLEQMSEPTNEQTKFNREAAHKNLFSALKQKLF